MKSTVHKWIKISLVTFSFAVLLFSAVQVNAGKDDNVFGWWWSDGVGWISLNNCTNPTTCSGPTYGVNITKDSDAPSGYATSGWAWSDNVGWITFDDSEWSDDKQLAPPGGLRTPNNFGSSGWARAINGKHVAHSSDGRDNRGGYDGWISLSGFGVDLTKDLSSTISGFTKKALRPITGYGWGSEVIGWVQSNSTYHKSFVAFDTVCNPAVDPTCAQNDLEVTINGKKTANILGGETVDIKWTAPSGFFPTECTGSQGGSTSPYPDNKWKTKTNGFAYQTTTGVYTSIHVPPSGTTVFRLDCTDGKEVHYGEVTVTAKLTATVDGGACINNLISTPTITWTTNDTSPECIINASPFYGDFIPYTIPTSGYLNASGTSPYTLNDTNYQHKDTFYKITCTNGDTGYKASVGPVTGYTKMCSTAVDYTVTKPSAPACSILKKDPNSSFYISDPVTLKLTPNNFTADAEVSVDTTNHTPKGTSSFSPSNTFSYNTTIKDYNTIDVGYRISASDFAKIIAGKPANTKGVSVDSVDLKIVAKSQNTDTKKERVYYCFDTDTICTDQTDPKCVCPDINNPICNITPTTPKVKPKYVPF